MDTGDLTRCKFQGVVVQDGFIFICECHMRGFCTCKSITGFILFLHIIKPSNCVKLDSIRNLLHQWFLLQERKHTLTTCQSLIQVIGKAGQCHNRAKRSHHGNGTGQDSVKTDLTFSIKMDRQRQHSKGRKQDHKIGK